MRGYGIGLPPNTTTMMEQGGTILEEKVRKICEDKDNLIN